MKILNKRKSFKKKSYRPRVRVRGNVKHKNKPNKIINQKKKKIKTVSFYKINKKNY